MKIIKFRAWDKTRKKMKYFETINDLSLYFMDNANLSKIGLMQFTGLKDKNGKEIYERDIVQTGVGGKLTSGIKRKADVRWFHRTGQWCIFLPTSFMMITSTSLEMRPFGLWQFECEVIGNIYENPELLEGD